MLEHTPLFFSTRDGGWFPTLRVLHQYPAIMKRLRADQGANNYGSAAAIPGKPARSVGSFVGTVASLGQEVQCFRA